MTTMAILAGGSSRRMGRDKAALPFNDTTLLNHIHSLYAPFFDEVLLSTAEDIPRFLPGAQVVTDEYRDSGPLAGIHAALKASSSDRVFFTPVDLPFGHPELAKRMLRCGPQWDAVVPYIGRKDRCQPLYAVYAKTCLPAIEEQLEKGEFRVTSFYSLVNVLLVPAETLFEGLPLNPEKVFTNLNRIEDYHKHTTEQKQ